MINVSKDPRGFYVALGVPDDASADDIKSAFRTKAKKLHPDYNPSPVAAKQFHRIHEAYQTLSDPLKRAAYDRGWRTVGGGGPGGASEPPKKEPPRQEHTEAPKPKPERPAEPETPRTTRARPFTGDQPVTCKCGTVTAQPRYIIFDMVWGRVNKVFRRGLAGVYCRTCADRTAVRASLISWLTGWWALPFGPRDTIKAIVSNMRGGRRPAERNARLLIRQSRAFRARGEMELARGCAEQALAFASNPNLRREVDSLLLSLSSFPARSLKDRWAHPGLAPMIQALPFAVAIGALAMSATLNAPSSISATLRDTVRAWTAPADTAAAPTFTASGRVYSVTGEDIELRTGPGANYQVVAPLASGAVVMVIEGDPSNDWVRAVTNAGVSGFVPMSALSAEVSVDALNAFARKAGQR